MNSLLHVLMIDQSKCGIKLSEMYLPSSVIDEEFGMLLSMINKPY